jgi:hypothetical protein
MFYVNVRRFAAVARIKEKPVRALLQYRRHRS